MRSPNDPIRYWRKRLIISAAVGLLAAGAALTWAMQPTPEREPRAFTPNAAPSAPDDDAAAEELSLDQSVFTVRLWNAPLAPATTSTRTATENRTPRIKPPEHQLIGIMHEAGVLHAVLYDPHKDKLIIVADGDSIDDFTVASITPERIVLKQNDFTHTLALREDRQ